MPDPVWEPALLAGLRPQGDADMLADCFTPHEGALTLLAKGLAKPGSHLAAKLKPADELRIAVTKRRAGWPLLTGCEPETRHRIWQDSLDHLALYWFMLDCAVTSSGDTPQNADVFRLLVNLLRSAPAPSALSGCACVFALKLLGLLGLLPSLICCERDGHAFTADEPVFLLTRGEGLIGRAAYNAHYARAASTDSRADVPQGLLRISPQRRARWAALLHGPLLDYPARGCDRADSALLTRLCANALADLAQRPLRTHEFLVKQWRLPQGRELAELLD